MRQIEDVVYRGCPPGENLMPSWQMRQARAREHNSSALLGCGKLALIAQEGRPLKRCPDRVDLNPNAKATIYRSRSRELAGLLSIIVLSNALLRRRGAPQPHSHRSRRAPVSPADPQREGPHSRRSPIAEVLLARGAGRRTRRGPAPLVTQPSVSITPQNDSSFPTSLHFDNLAYSGSSIRQAVIHGSSIFGHLGAEKQ
jgi:hypothetical protein